MLKFFNNYKEIVALISEKSDGSMKIFESGENDINRDDFFRKNGIDGEKIFSAEILHSACVKSVDKNSPKIIKGVDALVTKEKDIFLAVTVADCIPIYFYDNKSGVIGIAHAGWRGIVSGIVGGVLREMNKLGSGIGDIKITLGPGLRECHFEVRDDVLINFKNNPEFVFKRENRIFVDLFGIIKKELLIGGVPEENIFDSGKCTYCDENRFFSYRRDKPRDISAMVAVVGAV